MMIESTTIAIQNMSDLLAALPSIESLHSRAEASDAIHIALYGLSANPPTGLHGHQGVVRYLVRCGIFNEVWILPVYSHMFSSKSNLASFEDRVEMCRRSMLEESTSQSRVRVLELEKNFFDYYNRSNSAGELPFRVGTVDILEFLNAHYASVRFHLVLGTDTYNDLIDGKWKRSES